MDMEKSHLPLHHGKTQRQVFLQVLWLQEDKVNMITNLLYVAATGKIVLLEIGLHSVVLCRIAHLQIILLIITLSNQCVLNFDQWSQDDQ